MKISYASFLLTVLLLIVLTACGANQLHDPQMLVPTPTQPNQSICGPMSLDDPVVTACLATQNIFPRRERTQFIDGTTGYTTTQVVEYESSTRWKSGVGSPSPIVETVVVISPVIYLKQDSSWLELPIPQTPSGFIVINSTDSGPQIRTDIQKPAVDNVSTRLTGSEILPNNISTSIYESIWIYSTGKQSISKTWVGSDGLIYKILAGAEKDATLVTYEYDPSIKIEIPTLKQQ